MGHRLRVLREKAGWTQEYAAERFGLSKSGYLKIERGERNEQGLKDAYVETAMELYGVSREIVEGRFVQVVGIVGASAEMTLYDAAQGPFGEVAMPAGGTPDTVVAEVHGESLGALFDRWFVFYDDVRTPPTDDLLRELCVVGLRDGRVVVKKLLPGSVRGLYHLLSASGGVMENVEVEWAARVLSLAPR